jgi:hypothetical protein
VRLVRIPRHLLHVRLDDLSALGVREQAPSAERSLVADLHATCAKSGLSAELLRAQGRIDPSRPPK